MVLASIVSRTFKVANASRLVRERKGCFRDMPDPGPGAGIVPIIGTDPVARQDALSRVPAFLARFIMN